ncbi:MAG TPA: hypothetical protein VGH38_00735 [Bryobacteraceae bacterium]
MTRIDRRAAFTGFIALVAIAAAAPRPSDWTEAVEVRHEDDVCISYRARLDGQFLVVRATLGPGWHTFAMDNKQRADEKLDGKPALSVDRATEIASAAGLEIVGPWYQSPPKDFSRPELRWFSWGFDKQALFIAKVRRSRGSSAGLTLRGQACTATICKNIDVAISLPLGKPDTAPSEINLKDLVQVR